MFVFGWSFFWRAFLAVHIPYFLVNGLHKMAIGNWTGKSIAIMVSLWGCYFIWTIFALGLILNSVQKAHNLRNRYTAKPFSVGMKMVLGFVIFTLLYILPGIAIDFIVSFIASLALTFYGATQAESAAASKVAVYFIHSLISVFFFGYLAQYVISVQLRKEGKELIPPSFNLRKANV